MRRRAIRRTLALLAVSALVAAACGNDDDVVDPTPTPPPDETTTTVPDGEPSHGGTITIGQFSPPPGLDPARLAGGGTVGGMELFSIYDVLLYLDVENNEYLPGTAESIEPNDDFTEWTLRLREGLTFRDGNPYDAHAVKFVHDRQLQEGQGAPRGQFASVVESYEVVDDLTIVYRLRLAWTGFPYVLTNVNGLIYSPAAYEAAGEDFNTNPGDAGAGPFMVRNFAPGEELVLDRNPDYWNAPLPYLDTLVFRLIAGPAATYEAVRIGTFDAGYVRDPITVAQAEQDGFGMVLMPAMAGNMLNMNSGEVVCQGGEPAAACEGVEDGEIGILPTATADVRVRRAVAHAVDPEVLNQRVYDGQAMPNSAPWANSPWDPGLEGPQPDPDEARRLIEEAKADGWDGRIRVLSGNDPVGIAWAEAVASQLRAVGMEVDVDTSQPIQQIVHQVIVLRDFDITTWAYGMTDEHDGNYQQMLGNLACSTRRYGYCDPDMDAAIDLLRTAVTDEEILEAYRAISEIWIRDVPAHVTTVIPQALIHRPDLRDARRTAQSTPLFHWAWLDR